METIKQIRISRKFIFRSKNFATAIYILLFSNEFQFQLIVTTPMIIKWFDKLNDGYNL